jgi:hypothetical protein
MRLDASPCVLELVASHRHHCGFIAVGRIGATPGSTPAASSHGRGTAVLPGHYTRPFRALQRGTARRGRMGTAADAGGRYNVATFRGKARE